MKSIRILPAARRDLVRGYQVYERQAPGVGRYFLDTSVFRNRLLNGRIDWKDRHGRTLKALQEHRAEARR